MAELILAIDQGTTSTTVLLVDKKLTVKARSSTEFPQLYPKPGWVEHDPEAIWKSTLATIKKVLVKGKVKVKDIVAIGITNQRETTIVWDRRTGQPLYNAIVWQCRRTTDICNRLRRQGYQEMCTKKTGLVLDPYFSGSKIKWLMENVPGLKSKSQAGRVCFGTVDSFLTYRLTGGVSHVTDVSNASRTLLLDIKNIRWDSELIEVFDVVPEMLPELRGSSDLFGVTKGIKVLPDGIPITGMAGDQQSALFGQACFERGSAKCTYGTGSFLLMNTGDIPVISENKLLTTVAWKLRGADVFYALEGSSFNSGAAIQWLRDGLGVIKNVSDISKLAMQVEDAGGVVFVPAFTGLGAPHWRPEARGLLSGVTRSTNSAHIARAVLEGVALQHYDLVAAMEEDTGLKMRSLKVDGGASTNDLLMQYQADILGIKLIRPKETETTAVGAACLAGLGIGLWSGVDEIRKAWVAEKEFKSSMSDGKVKDHINRWNHAVALA